MMKNLTFALLLTTSLAVSSFDAAAQNNIDIQATPKSAYGQDNNGTIVRSDTGLCWRSGNWTAENAIPGCDGPLIPPIVSHIAPAIVPPTEQVTPIKQCNFSITLDDDQTFAFGKTALPDTAKKRIDRDILSKFTACPHIKTVTITGYTDHLGSTHANQQLSKQRANAVAEYLQGNGVLAKITTIGAGSADPIKTCKERNRTKLINCLAPNRRVSVIMQTDGE